MKQILRLSLVMVAYAVVCRFMFNKFGDALGIFFTLLAMLLACAWLITLKVLGVLDD